MSDSLNHQLAAEDLDVILAALRLLQRTIDLDIPEAIQEIGGESLKTVDIDNLCERLNLGESIDNEVQDERDHLIQRFRAVLSRPEWNSDTAANLATALDDAGCPIFLPGDEGWYLDVIHGAYAVVAKCDGPFQSNAEAMTVIAERFAAGSRWHGHVLDTIGMTACGESSPLLDIIGFGPNGTDVVVGHKQDPDRQLEVGPRPDAKVWSIHRRDIPSGEAQWVVDRHDQRSALEFCAFLLGLSVNYEIHQSFSSHFE